jgi:hypothetical protein
VVDDDVLAFWLVPEFFVHVSDPEHAKLFGVFVSSRHAVAEKVYIEEGVTWLRRMELENLSAFNFL